MADPTASRPRLAVRHRRALSLHVLLDPTSPATNAREMKGSGSQRGVSVDLGRIPRLCFLRVPDTSALTSLARGRQIQNDAGSGPGEARRTAELEWLEGCLAQAYENNN